MAENDVNIKFGASIDGLQKGIESAKAQILGLTEPLKAIQKNFAEIGEAIAAAFAVDKIEEFAESMAALGREAAKAQITLGIGPEQFAGLKLAAEDAGTSADQITRVFARMNVNLENESKRTATAIKFLGLSFKELNAEDAQQRLFTVGDALMRVQDAGARDAASNALLGRSFAEIALLLKEGAAGLDDWTDVAKRAGTVIGDDLQERMKATDAALVEMHASFQGLGLTLYSEFGPAIDGVNKLITQLVEGFTQAVREGGAVKEAMDGIGFAVKATVSLISAIVDGVKLLWQLQIDFAEDVKTAITGVGIEIADVYAGIGAGIGKFFAGLITAAEDAVSVIGQEFVDLGNVIGNAVTGHFAEAGAAFARIKTDAVDAGSGISAALKSAVSGFDFQAVVAEHNAAAKDITDRNQVALNQIRDAENHFRDEMDSVWGTRRGDAAHAAFPGPDIKGTLPPPAGARGANTAGRDANSQYQTDADAAKRAATEIEDGLKNMLALHGITMQQWADQTVAALDKESDAIQDAADKALATAGLTSNQKLAIMTKEQNELVTIWKKEADAQTKAALDAQKQWTDSFNTINSAVDSQISGLLRGTTSWGQALKNILSTLTEDVIKFFVNWGLKQAESAAATALGFTSGVASAKAMAAAMIGTDTGQAFAGFAAFLAPTLGPAAIPAATGLAGEVSAQALGLTAFDVGAWSVPNTGAAIIHAGETIIPAGPAQAFRDAMSGGDGGGGGVTHVWNINAADAQSFVNMLRNNSSELAKALNVAQRLNPSLQASF